MPAASTLRLVDPTGTELFNTGGWTTTRLNSVDVGYPDIREVVIPVSGAHGMFDTTQWFGERAITAVMTLPAGVAADAAFDTLAGLMNPGLRLYAYIQRPGWSTERRAVVRSSAFTCAPGVVRQAQCVWKMPAAVFEDSVLSSATLTPSGSAEGGFSFPLSFPLSFNFGLVPGAGFVSVAGNIPAVPIISIYGPCTDPLVRLVATGQQVAFKGLTVADGDFLQIDLGNRTVHMNGDPAQSRYSTLDFTSSSWWTLPVGANQQVVFSAQAPSGACQAIISWRSRWV
jgi:hypothetical protein